MGLNGLNLDGNACCVWVNTYPRGNIRCVYVGDGYEPYYCEWDGTGDPEEVLRAACADFAATYERGESVGDIECEAWIGTEEEPVAHNSFVVPDPEEVE